MFSFKTISFIKLITRGIEILNCTLKMDKAFPRRRNMGFIRNLDWAVDCRIFSNAVSANADPYRADAANLEIARRCKPNQEYMEKNPIRYFIDPY